MPFRNEFGEISSASRKVLRVAWRNMWDRCTNPEHKNYEEYEDLTICERWRDFENFLLDMGEKPQGLSLDRKDNNKGYSKDNCRWASWSEQSHNRRINSNNKSGLKGVFFSPTYKRWIAEGRKEGPKIRLYYGTSLLDACASRKSWELKNGVPQYA